VRQVICDGCGKVLDELAMPGMLRVQLSVGVFIETGDICSKDCPELKKALDSVSAGMLATLDFGHDPGASKGGPER
jgi:hypothetical protein